jgi:hypothetical protein
MRRMFLSITGALLVAGFAATAAHAGNPHFINASAAVNNQGALTISFKEAGLGNEVTLITASASATATYVCVNGGNKNPSAANKQTVSGQVTNTQPFTPHNGQITGSLSLTPPGPGSFSCPNGQRLTLTKVSYTNVSLADTTHGIAGPNIAGSFCAVLDPRFGDSC